MNKNFNIHEWRDSKNNLNEDGGTYETTIWIQDTNGHFYVVITDSEGEKQSEEFDEIAQAKQYIIDYLNQWDVS